MSQVDDLSRSLAAFDQNTTLTVVVELSEASWLVAGLVPGVDRQPLKKQEPDPRALLRLLERWRAEATKTGRMIERIVLAFEAGRDGFWLARWLRARGIEVYVIHSTSVAVSREHRRAKTDRLGIRGFKPALRKAPQRLEALRTPEDTPIPPNMLDEVRRDMIRLAVVREQIDAIERARLVRLEQAPASGSHPMVRLLARVIGVGIETADMLVQEVLSRKLRDRRAVARYVGLTGSPDESGKRRREKGLAKAGNARVRRGLIQLAWRFLRFQKGSALAQWYRARTEGPKGVRKTTMIVALARKLLIALWRLVMTGEIPVGVVLRAAA